MTVFKPVQYIEEVKREVRKVVWPTIAETRTTTILVFIMVIVSALFLFTVDQAISWVITFVLGIKG